MRTAFVETLCDLAARDSRVFLLTADLGWSVVEPFARAAYSTEKGDVTDIVATEFGFHLIKVTDRTEGEPSRFLEIREQALSGENAATEIRVVQLDEHPRLRGAAALVLTPAFAAPTVA